MRRSRSEFTNKAASTIKFGEGFAKKIIKTGVAKRAKVLALQGELGAGKTTFIKGFARGLGIKGKVLSPTFILIKKFAIRNPQFFNFYHIDCYRLKNPKDLLDLGFKKIIAVPQNIVAVEWAARVKSILPRKIIRIKFKTIDKNKREIIISK
ncbi:MAG: UPF0079 ATP-binding protein [Parcubacteria group bacterium Gr01-1014_30]|nr:MAG: UPF0079 ATP-binding protein [Parcubacteria group bacterium Gr01-1014_30]